MKWQPNPGPQTIVLTRQEREILYGGARGGGKTEAGIIWVALPAVMREGTVWQFPYYRGLVIRKHIADMNDWVDRAELIYVKLGARKVGRPPEFRFPSGAIVRVGHLRDEESYAKYLGHEYQRLVIEEVTQIPSLSSYTQLLGSLRSKYPQLPEQVLLTANPGGPGMQWVRQRFIVDEGGRRRPPGVPFLGEDGNWRIFIPATVDDNPYLIQNNPTYVAYLDSLPEPLRSAWRYGDWDVFIGQFFPEFRPSGPNVGDPPWANHVIRPIELKPWWPRWMACDWGYEHPCVVQWFVQLPNGQVHVYRELVQRKVGARVLGRRIAEESDEELSAGTISLALSPDAFKHTDEGESIAEQIVRGINEALGDGAGDFELTPNARIVVRPASNARIAGWMLVREFLRFIPAFPDESPLPKLQIWDTCTNLIDTLPIMVFDADGKNKEDAAKLNAVDGKGGDDSADCLRYGLMAWKQRQVRAPVDIHVSEKVAAWMQNRPGGVDPTIAYMVARKAELEYENSLPRPVSFRRASRLGGYYEG